ncbi:MAG: M61 family peptidase [Acidobacteria bacterium]|nr:MAG: M61 family peptidase [Acidobacteriota bacterium]
MISSRYWLYIVFAFAFMIGAPGLKAQSPITLEVDATQAPQKIIHTRMAMPVSPGPLTLYYPKWIPGEHEPDGPVINLTGLKFSGNGKVIPWRRDLLDMFTIHLDIPEGVSVLDINLDYVEPEATSGFTAGASATEKLVVISWNQNLLYPAGRLAEDLIFKASLKLPEGWKFGTALPIASEEGNTIEFKPASLNRLVDSPVSAGQYYQVVDVTPPGEPVHHEIDLAADSEAALNMDPELERGYTNLVAETGKLFGARHYRDYHFLFTLSDHVAHFGLEHHESDDSRVEEFSLIDPALRLNMVTLLPHEFVHSWNGKFRRPKDLSTAYYEEPMKTDMLWVYEGLTEYLGGLLTARSGLWTPDEYRQNLALIAARYGPGRPGRTWRPLLDTAAGAQVLYSGPVEWENWRRGVDFYDESVLLWLEVNSIINRETHGKKSLDDFCRLFYGGPNDGPQLEPYTFQDLVDALGKIAPYDWAGFFHERLNSTSPDAPLGGIEGSGWKVVYTSVEPPLLQNSEAVHNDTNETYSIGLLLKNDGQVEDSVVTRPAYKAGISPGMKVIAVNGRKFTPQVLRLALRAGTTSKEPLRVLVLNGEYYKTCVLDYHGGEVFPHLVREAGSPDLLDRLLKPLAAH